MRILICCLFALVLSGCTVPDEEAIPEPDSKKEEKKEIIKSIEFKTSDNRVTFTILNMGEYDKNYLQDTKKAILDNYKPLSQYLAEFHLYSEITISLKEEGEYNSVNFNTLLIERKIGTKNVDKRMLADSFIKTNSYNKGALFFEKGYIWYIHYKFVGKTEKEVKLREAKAVSEIIDNELYIPLEKLLYPDGLEEKLKENKTVVLVEAVSFTRYLIETYGIEDFVNIFDVENFDKAVRTTYGKDFKTLEEEWLQQY